MLQLPQPQPLRELCDQALAELKASLAALGGPGALPPLTLSGDGGVLVGELAAAGEAGPGALTFAVDGHFLAKAAAAGAAAVIITPALAGAGCPLPALVTPEPRLVFAVLLGLCGRRPPLAAGEAIFADRASVAMGQGTTVGAGAFIGRGVKLGRRAVVGPLAFIEEGVEIGDDSIIHPRAVLRAGTRVGRRCQIHCGAVIGDDGFGYTQLPDMAAGRLIHYKNAHLGGVVVEDDVEIGAQSTVDRGLVSDTVIGRGTKIDNLVQVGHNCHIGRDCILVSQVGVGGHSVLGDRVFLLGQVGLGPGVTIGADAILTGQAGFGSGALPAGRAPWSGSPARPMNEYLQTKALSASVLPKARKFFRLLKKAASFEELKAAFLAPDDKE